MVTTILLWLLQYYCGYYNITVVTTILLWLLQYYCGYYNITEVTMVTAIITTILLSYIIWLQNKEIIYYMSIKTKN